MTKSYFKSVFAILFCVFAFFANAQSYTFRPLTMDNGLSNFVVTRFFKDSVGFVWIGTDNSLDRFDGVEFRHFRFKSGDINKKRVRSIAETTSGNLFVGNGIGLWKLDKGKGELELVSADKINCGVSVLKWDSKERKLYVGTDKGLYVLNAENQLKFVPIHTNILSNSNYITGIEFDNNRVWLTTKKGLCSYEKVSGKITLYEYDALNSEQSFLSKITRIGKTLYMGTSKSGILCFDIDKLAFSRFIDVGSDIITDISGDGKDNIYVATDGNGVHFISHARQCITRSIRYEPQQKSGIRSNSIYSLLVDRDGIVWVGFYQAGLDYSLYQNSVFETYSFPPYFDSNGLPVRAFLVRDNEKLIGTREGLFYIREADRTVKSYSKAQLRSNLILSMCYYKGDYYVGTYGGGVSVLNPQTMSVRSLNGDLTLQKGHVFHFEEDADGMLWMATSGGLYRYNKEKNELVCFNSSNSQILSGNVFYVFFDSSKKGWIATENGLCIYDPFSKTIKTDIFPNGFFNKEIIKVIHEDSKHKLYFCPDKGSIYYSDIDMHKFSTLDLTKRFKERVILSILEDKNHNYWFGSDNGLISIRERQDNYHSFGFSDGIPDPVFSTDASFQDKTGKLWFGNAKGLLCIDPDKIKNSKRSIHPVLLTDFQVNGGELRSDEKENFEQNKFVTLHYDENNFKFRFVSLQFTSPSSIVYEYKLEGYDKEWQVSGSGQNEVFYNNLPSGKYIFRVRAEGNQSSEVSLEVKISSFFSYRFWLILLLVLCLVYLFTNKLIQAFRRLTDKISHLSSVQKVPETTDKQEDKYKFTKLPEEECRQTCEKLYAYMDTEKPYTNSDLKIVDLAKSINTSSHTLSYIFNQYLTKNYYDFINEYRVKEFQRLVADVDNSKYTLSALAEQCGFSSRASFFRSFKKLTGITPNEYIRSIGRTVKDNE